MILLTQNSKVVDWVKTTEIVSNGLKVTRHNDKVVTYAGGQNFTQTNLETLPNNIDIAKLGDYTYDGTEFTRVNFPTIKKSELLSKLTDDELGNIANYQTVIQSQEITEEDKSDRISLMNKIMLKFNSYMELDLGHPDTNAFSQAVVGCGLITEIRMNEILNEWI